METSLHRELKAIYAGDAAQTEVRLGRFRIDAVVDDELVEVQHGSLAAIRDKIAALLRKHHVRVVKPLVVRKTLIKRAKAGGRVIERRASPKRAVLWDLFHELIYFTRVFPHRRLTLEVPLVEVEEWRFPGHGRRRRWRRSDFEVEDQKLVAVTGEHVFRTAGDLTALLPHTLPCPFHTGDLAHAAEINRFTACRIAYCLRKMGAVEPIGKRGNAVLYRRAA
ncbi:MAG TPA: hypothetical protein VFE24_03435 [Pirellulales bacterium]|nr:hypothetical protein [Pirellulales bacterium]